MVGVEIVEVLADPQNTAFANHMLLESPIDAGFGQCVFEKMARSDAHFDGLLFGGHGEDYKGELSAFSYQRSAFSRQ